MHGCHRTCTRTLGGKHTRKSASFWQRKHVQYFLIKFAKYLMLESCWLWFVILKKYMELTRPKIESRDPIFFTGTRARSRVYGNDRLFLRGSEFGPNPEIPPSPVIQLRPRPDVAQNTHQQSAYAHVLWPWVNAKMQSKNIGSHQWDISNPNGRNQSCPAME